MAREFMPILAMVIVQTGFAGMNVISKLALNSGMSSFVMVAYRQILAAVFSAPFAYFSQRKKKLEITRSILFQIFLCASFGATMNQCFYFLGLKYSTPTIACALQNLLPAITFIMAVPFRLETVGIKSFSGQAKVIGTVICVGGAMFMTFYKGKPLNIRDSGIHWRYVENLVHRSSNGESNMILGSVLVIGSSFAWASWFTVQAKMKKDFASPYTISAIMCFISSFECVIIGACVERDISKWSLGWDIKLFTVAYSGIICSGISFALMTWCIQKRGPLFVAMFNPLLLIMVAVFGWAILEDKLHVGTVLGSILIVVGLYFVLWGKGKDVNGKTLLQEEKNKESGPILTTYARVLKDGKCSEQQRNGEIGVDQAAVHSIDCSRSV